MKIGEQIVDQIVVTTKRKGRLVTADEIKEVIAIISDDEIIYKDGYEVRVVAAQDSNY